MHRCMFDRKARNKNPPCYMCGGRTRKSWANYYCIQDNGPCGWQTVRWSRKGPRRTLSTWESTKQNIKNGVLPRYFHDNTVSIMHSTGFTVNTRATKLSDTIHEKHSIIGLAKWRHRHMSAKGV